VKRTPLKRTKRLTAKRKPKANKGRTAIEFQRIYGSKRRVEFVKNLPCIICAKKPCENAHTTSGGMGRKADYTSIVPLCQAHHRLQHQKGWKALGMDAELLKGMAYLVQWRWATRPDDSA
jgi:hypothetical protein